MKFAQARDVPHTACTHRGYHASATSVTLYDRGWRKTSVPMLKARITGMRFGNYRPSANH